VATPTVVIASRDDARADALTRALEARRPVTVSATWPMEEALVSGAKLGAASVVLDGFPPSGGLRVIDELARGGHTTRVLVIGPAEPDVDVLVALASGVDGYLPAASHPALVADAVMTLLGGGSVLPRRVSDTLVQHVLAGGRGIVLNHGNGHPAVLTSREWEVLVMLRQGRSTAEIAQRLVVSKATVRSHIAALVHKFAATDRANLVDPATTPAHSAASLA
jgi:DNA-binding NarL/FixJ family response regulator